MLELTSQKLDVYTMDYLVCRYLDQFEYQKNREVRLEVLKLRDKIKNEFNEYRLCRRGGLFRNSRLDSVTLNKIAWEVFEEGYIVRDLGRNGSTVRSDYLMKEATELFQIADTIEKQSKRKIKIIDRKYKGVRYRNKETRSLR